MISWLHARMKSFQYAFQGFRVFFSTEVHGKVHAVAACIAIAFGLYYNISNMEWLWLSSAIASVIATEIINSAIEVLVDMVSPEKSEMAGKAKDMAAAAVVVAAAYAVIVGFYIFFNPLFDSIAALIGR